MTRVPPRCTRPGLWAEVVAIFVGVLLWVPAAVAAVPLALPPGEESSPWSGALTMSGFALGEPGGGAGVWITRVGERWRVDVRDDRGGLHAFYVEPPATDRAREDLVWLAQSLLHPSSSLLPGAEPGVGREPVEPGVGPVVAPRPRVVLPPAWVAVAEEAGGRLAATVSAAGHEGVVVAASRPPPDGYPGSTLVSAPDGALSAAVEEALDWYALVPRPVPLLWVSSGWVSSGVQLRGGLPTELGGGMHARVSLGDWGGEGWVYGTGGAAPDGLVEGERLWEGYAGLGVGWEGRGTLAPALAGGLGWAAARVQTETSVQWGGAPSAWVGHRAAWSLGRGWALQLEILAGYDAAAPTFVSGPTTTAALERLWVRPQLGLAWGARYAAGTPAE